VEAAGHILRGCEAEAGRPAIDVLYWDAVAALASLVRITEISPDSITEIPHS
jgi:hypothetical protein